MEAKRIRSLAVAARKELLNRDRQVRERSGIMKGT